MKKILDNIVLYIGCGFIVFGVVLLSLYFMGPKATVEVLKDSDRFIDELTGVLGDARKNNK